MLKKAKKILALALTVLMVCSIFPMAAFAANTADPVVYILGYGGVLFADKTNYASEEIYPLNTDVMAEVEERMAPCLLALAAAQATGDYGPYCDEIYKGFAPIYDGVRLNPDGTAKTDEATGFTSGKDYKINGHKSEHWDGLQYYVFYDWRLSPLELVKTTIIPTIEAAAEKSPTGKVDVVGRCYGANLISTYLAQDENACEKIDDVIMYVPSTEGIGLIGRIFSGNIELNPNNIRFYANEILKYADVIEDSYLKSFIDLLLFVFEQAEILNFGTDTIQDIVDAVNDDLIPRLVRTSYGSFPSFWAMIPQEYFYEAVDFVYNTDELREEYKGTIDLITKYHETVQRTSDETLKAQEKKGIDIHVVSKYNLPSAPLFGKSNPLGDAIAETSFTSFGATTASYGKVFSAAYISEMDEADKKYLSPDKKIDASTCLFPETTWFIKNCYHDYFEAEALYTFLNTILTTDNMTIDTYEEYPQFIDADITAETLTPVEGMDPSIPNKGSDDEMFQMLFKFIIFVLQTLTKLINGELSFDLGSLLG